MGERRRFPKAARVRRPEDINRAFRRGRRRRTAHLDIFWVASPESHARFGFVVAKYGQTAVSRNRLRRRLREIGRREVLPLLDAAGLALDVLVRARREAYDAPFAALLAEILEVMEGICSSAPS